MKLTMIRFKNITRGLLVVASTLMLFSACNKDPEDLGSPLPPPPTGSSLSELIQQNPDDSLYYRLIVHAGMSNLFTGTNGSSYTMFIPGNAAMKAFITAASGGAVPAGAPDAVFSGFITTQIPVANAAAIVSYNTIPQGVTTSGFGNTFPNYMYPTLLNPAPSISPFLRLTTFLSTRNGNWVSNIPLVGVNEVGKNGVIHHSAALSVPPQRYLWDRINTDPNLTYFKAAIIRGDSATRIGGAPGQLQSGLMNIGANLTIFAPTDDVFRATLTAAITQVLINMGIPAGAAAAQAATWAATPDVFDVPELRPVLTAQTVQGLLTYHILGKRVFTNNFPTTATNFPTLLNGVLTTHPGLTLQVTMGAPFATAATVKGLENATAANITINASPLLPDPVGTSDQNYLNGVIHKINQVLMPLPLSP